MKRKCSGRNCPMQHGTVNVGECEAAESCQWFTPEVIICSHCRIFPAIEELHGKPLCGFCKTQIEMSEQFAKLQSDIYSGFKRLEEEISGKR